MMRLMLMTVLALAANAASARTLELIEGAYELVLGEVIMPNGAAGTTVFRVCESCDSIGMPVGANTRYTVSGRELALPDFLEAVARIRQTAGGNTTTFVGVYYDMKTRRVTHIAVVPQR